MLRNTLTGASAGGVTGGVLSEIMGGDFWDGFRQGATSGAVSGAAYGVLKADKQDVKPNKVSDDDFVHVTTPEGAKSIKSKGLDPEFSGYVTKWKHVKNISNPSDFNEILYSKELWQKNQSKFDNGFKILKINAKPVFYSPRTNWTNGVPQYKFDYLVSPTKIIEVK